MQANTVFAGAGATAGDGFTGDRERKRLSPRELCRIVRVMQYQHMKIAIADMADDRRKQSAVLRQRLTGVDAVGKT